MKVALVYDRVNKWGGAERVLLALHKIFPDAPLYTSLYDKSGAKWAKNFKVVPSFLQKGPFIKRSHEFLSPLMPIAFETHNFKSFDLVISITSEASKGILVPPQTRHICICLTPTRYLYTGFDEYFSNDYLKFISTPFIKYLKLWDKAASARPDKYIAISKTVKNRIKNIYGRDSTLIYPPISESFFSKEKDQDVPRIQHSIPDAGYYLVVSRLVSYKKIDLAINAANKLKTPLVIIGEGRKKSYLQSIAGNTVTFEGFVTEEKLIQRYTNAKALIFPGNEDLGLTMIEAQACGTPVIAYRKGGATELIKEGVTGEFFEDQTVDSLSGVMEKFNPDKYNSDNCVKNAQRFNFDKFKEDLLELI